MQKLGRGEEIAKRERRESAQIVLGKKYFLDLVLKQEMSHFIFICFWF